jgi:hypothetical protein
MEFTINKNSTLPLLMMELIKDGRNDFKKFYELVQNADIFFSMYSVDTGVTKIGRKKAYLTEVEPISCAGEEFYLTYQFTSKETSVPGKYVGVFEITFLDGSGTLIVPIKEELFININNGSIKL